MIGKSTVVTLVVALCAAAVSQALGYNADVRERMIVRNLVTAKLVDSIRPVVAKDVGPGYGIFDYSEGPIGFGWPLVAASRTSSSCSIAMLDSGGHLLSRSRVSDWPLWDSAFDVADSGNQPMCETHNIASSPVSNKVCITWVRTDTNPMPGYYRLSSDGGASWDSVKQLDWPAAYGGDTVTSFHVSSLYPFYDGVDRLHVVAAVHPIVNDTGFIMPAGIWHWCPDDNPNWKLIRRAGCAPEHLAAPVGYNALYACRPSGCFVDADYLLLTWEQFDSANVDPQTNLLRAGIHCAYLGGYFDTVRVTEPGPYSCRFPVASACSVDYERAIIRYEIDQVAGFSPLGQGPSTYNPVVTRRLSFPKGIELGDPDTIGGTTYDLQACGPARTVILNSPGHGIHAVWMYSEDTSGAFADLNMHYNFYDYAAHLWNWLDPDFMQSGMNAFPYRTGLGCLSADSGGAAIISACNPPPAPYVAVEDSRERQLRVLRPSATILRGVLFLPPVLLSPPSSLLSVDGRKVMDLRPGANDVGHLSPGVYFVREAQAQAQATRKVVITR